MLIIPGLFEPSVRTLRFFRNYPFPLLLIYLNLASSNRLPQRPYMVLFIILSLLNIPGSVTPVSGVLETAILEVRKP